MNSNNIQQKRERERKKEQIFHVRHILIICKGFVYDKRINDVKNDSFKTPNFDRRNDVFTFQTIKRTSVVKRHIYCSNINVLDLIS